MADFEGGTLYQMNKQVVKQTTTYTKDELKEKVNSQVIPFFKKCGAEYYMMLCHEQRDYTVFRLTTGNPTQQTAKDVFECLFNRGKTYSIEPTQDGAALEIWIKINSQPYCYYLFSYNEGVLES